MSVTRLVLEGIELAPGELLVPVRLDRHGLPRHEHRVEVDVEADRRRGAERA